MIQATSMVYIQWIAVIIIRPNQVVQFKACINSFVPLFVPQVFSCADYVQDPMLMNRSNTGFPKSHRLSNKTPVPGMRNPFSSCWSVVSKKFLKQAIVVTFGWLPEV